MWAQVCCMTQGEEVLIWKGGRDGERRERRQERAGDILCAGDSPTKRGEVCKAHTALRWRVSRASSGQLECGTQVDLGQTETACAGLEARDARRARGCRGLASEAPQVSSIQRRKCLHLAAKFFFPLEQYSLRYCVHAFFTHSFRFC